MYQGWLSNKKTRINHQTLCAMESTTIQNLTLKDYVNLTREITSLISVK